MMPNLISKDELEIAHLSNGRVTLTNQRVIFYRKNGSIQQSVSLRDIDRISLTQERSKLASLSTIIGLLLIAVSVFVGLWMLSASVIWLVFSIVALLRSRNTSLSLMTRETVFEISLKDYNNSVKKLLADFNEAHFNSMHNAAIADKKETKTVKLNTKVS